MTDTLLRSLREHLLDESQPLAGLLRKCLLLGAETGSETLRSWARKELNGYGDDDEVPAYRRVPSPAISMNSISGNTWSKNRIVDRYQLPVDAQEFIPDHMSFKHPIEELERLADQKQMFFASPALAYAQTVWNEELGPFQEVVGLSYVMSGSVLAGILGQVRTKLVDVVADLTADTPLSELPKKGQVDAAVSHRIGDVYNTTIQAATGPVAIGAKASASAKGLSVEDALRLLDKVQQVAVDITEAQRAELVEAVADLRTAVESDEPDTGEVVKKAGKLRAIADKIGVATVTAATDGATQALIDLALNGGFG
ncbi:hypothetical protein [Actinoplanes sp. NPDC051859]|uniref:AbiTii domain-containing protein n=1 Tax=Actinoplanes sp. NPDC051859 TaxID=3363909 RepID=UPI00378B0881